MVKSMKYNFFYAVASFLSALAVLIVKPASVLYIYQGETPEELLK